VVLDQGVGGSYGCIRVEDADVLPLNQGFSANKVRLFIEPGYLNSIVLQVTIIDCTPIKEGGEIHFNLFTIHPINRIVPNSRWNA